MQREATLWGGRADGWNGMEGAASSNSNWKGWCHERGTPTVADRAPASPVGWQHSLQWANVAARGQAGLHARLQGRRGWGLHWRCRLGLLARLRSHAELAMPPEAMGAD